MGDPWKMKPVWSRWEGKLHGRLVLDSVGREGEKVILVGRKSLYINVAQKSTNQQRALSSLCG